MSRPGRRFLFRLAGHLGKTVGQIEREMTSRELSEWMAFDRLDAIPDPWQQTGILASTMANLWTDKGGYKPDDFIPRPRRVRILSAAEGLAWMRGVAAGVAARLKREKDPSPPSAGSRSGSPPTPPDSPRG